MSNMKIKEDLKKELEIYRLLKKEFLLNKQNNTLKEIYVINKEWYDKWKAYVNAEDLNNDIKDTSFKKKKSFGHPGKINNYDIVYNPKEFINEKTHETLVLKEDLKDKLKIISSSIWFFFFKKYEGGPEIKRQFIEIEEDIDVNPSMVLDIFHKIVRILIIKVRVLFIIKIDNSIILDQIMNIEPFKIFVSPYKTIFDLKKIIISSFFSINPISCTKNYIRMWRLEETYQLENLREFINNKKPCILKEKSLLFPGYLFDFIPNLRLEEVELSEKDIFVTEVIIQKTNKEMIPLFKLDNNYREQKCDHCHTDTFLFNTCRCQRVWYCNEKCMINDYKQHKKKCAFPNKNLIEEVIIEESKESLWGNVGIKNLGNTCYMNTALQCLSNCYELTLYFLKKKHKNDLNKENELGQKGLIALNYGRLMRYLWHGKEKVIAPVDFKRSISRLNSNFIGYNQQDCQEFLLYILDALHEDLNKVKKKTYTSEPDSTDKSDNQASYEAWIHYLTRNQSIIMELFCGQYKSTISCLTCNINSVKFDPYYVLSLPIPDLEYVEVKVAFIFYNLNSGCILLNVKVEQEGLVINLRRKISKILNIPIHCYLLCSLINNRIDKIFNNITPVIKLSSVVCCFQIDPFLFNSDSNKFKKQDYHEPSMDFEINLNLEDTKNYPSFSEEENKYDPIRTYYSQIDPLYNSLWELPNKDDKKSENSKTTNNILTNNPHIDVNLKIYCDENNGFGNDFIKVIVYLRAQRSVNSFSFYNKKDLSFPRIIYLNKNWKLSFVHRYIFSYLKDFLFEFPKYSLFRSMEENTAFAKVFPYIEKIQQANLNEESVPYLIKIINNNAYYKKPCLVCNEINCNNCMLFYNDIRLISLLQRYPKVNNMIVDNNYLYFDMIQRKVCISKNDFELEILFNKGFINSEKYFSQAKISKTSNNSILNNSFTLSLYNCLNRFIQIEDLDADNAWLCTTCKTLQKAKKKIDISKSPPILIIQLKRFKHNHKIKTHIDFPLTNLELKYYFWKNKKTDIITKYDLFGVCNHYGSLSYGHYVAFCKNFLNGKWFKYDDAEVIEMSEKEVISPNAYVLFYRRKDLANREFNIEELHNKPFVDYDTLMKNNYVEEDSRNNNSNQSSNDNVNASQKNNIRYLKSK